MRILEGNEGQDERRFDLVLQKGPVLCFELNMVANSDTELSSHVFGIGLSGTGLVLVGSGHSAKWQCCASDVRSPLGSNS